MDGTLTVAIHNFLLIRKKLGLPQGLPILETIETYPEKKAKRILSKLDKIEYELALRSNPQNGVYELLHKLKSQNKKLGIITRNSIENAHETLNNCKLSSFFERKYILGRESCKPKPSPECVKKLMDLWNACPSDTIMVGDYLFDLLSGRAAGVFTIYLDVSNVFKWKDYANLCVSSMHNILKFLHQK